MPKRYTVEMTITNDEGTQVDDDSHFEWYENDQQAKGKFQEKKQAARNAGKGSKPPA
jgi:hypothetical protein